MKITSEESRKYVGTFRDIRHHFFFILVGVFLTVVGVLLSLSYKEYMSYPTTEAEIVDIYSYEDESNTQVAYTVDGKEYCVWLNEYSSSYDFGDLIKIHYNPVNPQDAKHVNFFFPAILLGLGLLSFVYTIISIFNNHNRRKEIDEEREMVKVYGNSEEFNSEFAVSNATDVNEYYFHFCGKANQSHIMETSDRQPVMEARLMKFSLLGNSDYDFINYEKGTTTPHLIGKTVGINEDDIDADAWFDYDNQNIWDYIHANGIKLDIEMGHNLFETRYHIRYNDCEIGVINTAGTDILENVKSNAFTKNAHTPGLYRIYTSRENTAVMFLVTLTLARSDNRIHQ